MADPRPTIEAPDDDPYLWLEERESPQALTWVEAQNAATLGCFGDSRFAAGLGRAQTYFRPARQYSVSQPARQKLFNPWQDAGHPRGLWRTTSFESFRSETPEWDVLIDLDVLAAKEGED